MEIIEKSEEGNVLKLVVNSNEESFFFLLKAYLEKLPEVDIVGINKPHYLVDKTEFYLKSKKGSPLKLLKDSLKSIKKDLEEKKLK